ncbi:MAG: sensor histidine kinase [Lachnospiraceae bacterium]
MFCREQIPAGEFFEDLKETTEPLFAGKTALTISWEDGIMNMEWDLMKTLVMNLMDNAGKSGATQVEVLGIIRERGYEIAVRDNGRGIPAEKLPHIQEAFTWWTSPEAGSRTVRGWGWRCAGRSRLFMIPV